jgi:hypothetical protein
MPRTSLNNSERNYLEELHKEVRHMAKGFVARKVGVMATAEFTFADAWNDALLAVAQLMLCNKWDYGRHRSQIRGHLCWLTVTWFRKRSWESRCKRVQLTDDVLKALFKGEAETDEPIVSVTFEAAMDHLARMRPAKSYYLYELMELVKGGDCPVQCFHSGMVKKLQEHLRSKGTERTNATVKTGLRRARDELWERMQEAGIVRGERPKIDRQTAEL